MAVTWAYVQYSGEMRELGDQIDILANLLWVHVSTEHNLHFMMKPFLNTGKIIFIVIIFNIVTVLH